MISIVASPPTLLFGMILLTAHASGLPAAWGWAWIYLALAACIPMVYLVWLYLRGTISDFDVSIRSERLKPMLFTLGCMTVAGVVLRLGGAPRVESAWAMIIWIELALVMAITQHWKISIHGAAAAASAAMLWSIAGPVALLMVPVVLLVGWSRVHLLRHTRAQTVAGALLGALVTTGLLRLLVQG